MVVSPDFSAPCKMRFSPRDGEDDHFEANPLKKWSFSLCHVGNRVFGLTPQK